MHVNISTILLIFSIYVSIAIFTFEVKASEDFELKVYHDAYNIERHENFPIPGSKAVVFNLKMKHPPSSLIDFYENMAIDQGATNFPYWSATRTWRTYHKDVNGALYRTKEYLSSWWNQDKTSVFSLALRYSTPATLTEDTNELSVTIQQSPLTEADFIELNRKMKQELKE